LKQVALIFWKDLRYLWRELILYAVLLTSFAVAAPQTWLGGAQSSFASLFVNLLKLLMTIFWLVLMTRVVHADNLVGEEQFWLTRTYSWVAMLIAKLCFVVLCIVMPFVLMQWAMLFFAGLNPFASEAGMALSLFRFTLDVWLPFLVVTSVTESFSSAFTFLAGMFLGWAGLLTLLSSGTDMRTSPPYVEVVFGVLFGGLMLGILTYQFARRKTMISRFAIAAMLLLFVLLLYGYGRAAFGAPVKALIRNHYSLNSSLRMLFTPTGVPYEERHEDMDVPRGELEVKLPIQLEGLPSDWKIQYPSVAVKMNGSAGHYAPPWQSAVVSKYGVAFLMPINVFDRLSASDVTVHLELAAEELRPERMEQFTVAERFAGPMNGICSLIRGKVICRYAYREWIPTRAEIRLCNGDLVGGKLRHVPAGTVPDPVVNEMLPFKGDACAGDQIHFTEYRSAGTVRVAIDLNAISLRQYRVQ
jgi:hypothetical protein